MLQSKADGSLAKGKVIESTQHSSQADTKDFDNGVVDESLAKRKVIESMKYSGQADTNDFVNAVVDESFAKGKVIESTKHSGQADTKDSVHADLHRSATRGKVIYSLSSFMDATLQKKRHWSSSIAGTNAGCTWKNSGFSQKEYGKVISVQGEMEKCKDAKCPARFGLKSCLAGVVECSLCAVSKDEAVCDTGISMDQVMKSEGISFSGVSCDI